MIISRAPFRQIEDPYYENIIIFEWVIIRRAVSGMFQRPPIVILHFLFYEIAMKEASSGDLNRASPGVRDRGGEISNR
jgi:hypothetical protein